jgi:hypothetical protein
MQEIQYKLEVQRTNLTTKLVALVAAVFGVGLLYFSNISNFWVGLEVFQRLVRDLGSLCVVTVAITVIWQLTAKRAFGDELLTKAHISQQLAASGIVQLTYEPQPVNWEELFGTTRQLDLFFAYAKNWRGSHENRLSKLATMSGCTIRVVLPDPDNDMIVKDLANRFNKSEKGIRERILDAESEFSQMRVKNLDSGAKIEIWYTSMCPVFTIYRFDMAAILALYSYRRIKGGVPHIVAARGGSLFEFVNNEFQALIDPASGLSRRVV